MSEKLLKLALHELLTVRVRCKKCDGPVLEMPIEKLADTLDNMGRCRFCAAVLMLPEEDRLAELGRLLSALKNSPKVEISFVVAAEDKE